MDNNQKWLLKTHQNVDYDQEGYHHMFDASQEVISKIIVADDDTYRENESKIVDALWVTVAEMGPFNLCTDYNQDRIQRTLLDYLNLYRLEKIKEITAHSSEIDYLTRFWDCTYMTTFMRVNADRDVSGLNPIDDWHRSLRPDMVVMNDGLEVVYGECGKEDCTRMRATIMDCPADYVTRLLHMKECEISTDPTLITTDLFDILKIMLKVKDYITEPVYAFQEKDDSKKLTIPPSLCLASANKRQKVL
ncbi:hypothetical protein INT45_012452 [Circinella minor]|uniref:Uncharacterized protein n=1 Tax=Circinella minor TaxID=1195481 RepID=A0A8H7S3F9_9FUNG|nr:hypothetical protein INT45_012452 [Circinella minor]